MGNFFALISLIAAMKSPPPAGSYQPTALRGWINLARKREIDRLVLAGKREGKERDRLSGRHDQGVLTALSVWYIEAFRDQI